MIKNFEELKQKVESAETKRIALVCAEDKENLEAIRQAVDEGLATAVLTGDEQKIKEVAKSNNISLDGIDVIDTPEPATAAEKCCQLIRSGEASVIMKGLLDTSVFMRAVLNKETGLNIGRPISSVAVFQIESYHKLLMMADPAINVAPDLKQKVKIIENCVSLAHALGLEKPLVACCTAVEKVNESMPATVDAALLAKMSDRGQIKGCIVDGPFALDNAISADSAKIKKVTGPVAGNADIILCNDIESANYLYKCLIFLAKAQAGIIVEGAAAPIVLTSRADSHEVKYLSILMALIK